MTYKIVKNALGQVTACGPDEDYFDPVIPVGGTVELSEVFQTPYEPPPSALEQIRALEAEYADAQAKLTRQSLLTLALDKACQLPEATGLSRQQVHAILMNKDKGYTALYNLEAQVAALRSQVP